MKKLPSTFNSLVSRATTFGSRQSGRLREVVAYKKNYIQSKKNVKNLENKSNNLHHRKVQTDRRFDNNRPDIIAVDVITRADLV